MGKIKRIFWFIVFATIGLAVLVALSLRGERNYLENCKTLSVKCEPGRMHTTIDQVSKWLGDSYTQAKREWGKEPESRPSLDGDSPTEVEQHESVSGEQ